MSRFVIDPDGSLLRALARSSVHPFGYTATVRGAIDVDTSGDRFDLSSGVRGALEVELEALRGDDPHTDAEMHRRLDTHRFPVARAAVREVGANGGDSYRLIGDVTLRGVTRPLQGDAIVRLEDGRLHATGTATLDLREFGVKVPTMILLRVHPHVEVSIDLVADLESADIDLADADMADLDGEVAG